MRSIRQESLKNAAGISGIVLTKLDGTAKGGVVLAIREELQLPVKFIGVGEKIQDLQPFDAHAFAAALFEKEMMTSRKQMRMKKTRILTIFIRINVYEVYHSNP